MVSQAVPFKKITVDEEDMSNIQWDTAWNIGIKEIDEQHQKWIEIFNRLERTVLSQNNKDLYAIQKLTIKEMLEYGSYHFKSEEKIMQECNYPEAFTHWRMHKDFEKIIYDTFRDFEKGRVVLNTQLLSLMNNWLFEHILVEDKKIGIFLNS